MIGLLPKSLIINQKEMAIRTDYRVALNILCAFQDAELSNEERILVMLKSLYIDFDKLTQDDIEEAVEKASWFIDGGKDYSKKANSKKLIDWEQDESIIFSGINKVACKEIRELNYLHWWTFLSYFQEIDDGMFATVMNIRSKKARGKKLEKHEQEFLRNNKEIVELKHKYSAEEQAEIDRLNSLLH